RCAGSHARRVDSERQFAGGARSQLAGWVCLYHRLFQGDLASAAARACPRSRNCGVTAPREAPLAVRLVPEYAVLVFALGMTRAWFFPELTPAISHSFWLATVLAAAGTLFVIPTAGEVPIIQVLQQFGLGGAGAAALLITLPALSLPSLAM